MIEGTTLKTGVEVANEAALTMSMLQSGKIKPISTGDPELDDALLGGFLPGSILTIAGYSFQGKTYEMEKIQRHIMDKENDVILLQCSWEIEGLKIITRDLSNRTNQSAQEVMFNAPAEELRRTYKEAFDKYRKDNMFFQPEPVSADQFETDVMHLIKTFPHHRILVTIDNLENILVDRGSQKECMDKILYRVNVLKKRHPFIAFLILNQMNNDYVKRSDNLKGHRPLSSDLYQTAQLFKISDVVLFKIMPTRFGITDKFMVFGDKMYPHLDEHKIPSTGNTTSFDPFGKIFYFYLKARESDPKRFQDLHVKQMYTREDRGMPPLNHTTQPKIPEVSMPKIPEVMIPVSTLNNSSAKGQGFDEPSFL